MNEKTLQISIPTFNRPIQLEYNLASIYDAVLHIETEERNKIGVTIYNNSTSGYSSYNDLFEKYSLKFQKIKMDNFKHVFTGFDIGGPINCTVSILKSDGKYTWFLPDDDLAALDSIKTILEVIKVHDPCMIHGGVEQKTFLNYKEVRAPQNYIPNKIYKIYQNISDKENAILDTELIQAQEHVYKTSAYKNFVLNDDYINCVDDMMPGLFSLICIKNNSPLVMLSKSIGLFRDGDPSSGWRHSWAYMALNQWPDMVNNYVKAGLINIENKNKAVNVYVKLLNELSRRPDILLGLNMQSYLNPFKTFKNFGLVYIRAVILSPLNIFKKLIGKYK